MATRRTRKTGILKPRLEDQKAQRALDAIVERLEILDGLRGNELDRAVTLRDLFDSGYNIPGFGRGGGGPGSTSPIAPPPITGGPEGPGVGPAGPPTGLAATETFLALMLTWTNTSVNLQHVEVWRSSEDNLSTAVLIGTTVAPMFMDYVGANASYYYWVRSVGTDGSFSAYNDTQGTLGTTGVDPSSFEFNITVTDENLDALLSSRIDLIDNPTTGLVDRTTALEGDVVSIDSRTTTLESNYTTLLGTVDSNTTLINAEATINATQTTQINTLTNDLGTLEGLVDLNTAGVAANASSILNLEASVGALSADAGIVWEFETDQESWTATNSTITAPGDVIIWTPSTSDPILTSPTFSVSGGTNTQVVMRVRQIVAGGTWEGRCYYETPGHSISGSYWKSIPDPGLVLSQWQTLTWDMTDLTSFVSPTDWVDSTITKIRFDLVSDNAGKFEIDWIMLARYSTAALAEAIDALDVRVTTNENTTASQATQLTLLQTEIDDPATGLQANADAIAALTSDVTQNGNNISANTSRIVALETTVDNPTTGVSANASAISQLSSDVTLLDGVVTAQASDVSQLVATVSGGSVTLINPLTQAGFDEATTLATNELQAYNIGGRTGYCARIATNGNIQRFLYNLADGDSDRNIKIEPNGVYEVKFSVYHNRPTDQGSFYFGIYGHNSPTDTFSRTVNRIQNGGEYPSTNPYWFVSKNTENDDRWLDCTFYILGKDADITRCPDYQVRNAVDNLTFAMEGMKLTTDYCRLRFLNYNGPGYGDSTTTTVFFTDATVRRIDQSSDNYAALRTESSVRASETGDIRATYAVQTELTGPGGTPVIAGFGLMSQVIDGIASSSFQIKADKFIVTHPSTTTLTQAPFTVGLVNGTSTVGINGQLIVDGTIRGTSIIADTIGAREISVTDLSAISANTGTLTSNLIRTAASGYRVELSSSGSLPIWYGTGSKTTTNSKFYVDKSGNVVVKGLLQAGMIRQSFFTPASASYDSFRIATQYPSFYSGGVYTGKKAHLLPMKTVNETTSQSMIDSIAASTNIVTNGYPNYTKTYPNPIFNIDTKVFSDVITFLGPFNSSATSFGRLGTYDEMMLVQVTALFQMDPSGELTLTGNSSVELNVQYRYDSGSWQRLVYFPLTQKSGLGTLAFSQAFRTKSTSWNTLEFRVLAGVNVLGESFTDAELFPALNGIFLQNMSLTVFCPNFGVSDASGVLLAG